MSAEILAQRDETVRENWVRTMQARIVREELQKCHKAEGVNHYQVCHELAKTYQELLRDAKVSDDLGRTCGSRAGPRNSRPFTCCCEAASLALLVTLSGR